MNTVELYKDLSKIVDQIPMDFGGGCPISKSLLMAKIALSENLKTYVEIGIYRGRSFFPMARAMQLLGGVAYGIDPYTKEAAYEFDVEAPVKQKIDELIVTTDFSEMYAEVTAFRQAMGFEHCSEILRSTSSEAIDYFRNHRISIDMLHIDGNHDTKFVLEDIDLYMPLVKEGGYIVLDDIDWNSVKPALNKAIVEDAKIIFIEKTFTILQKVGREESPTTINKFVDQKRLSITYNLIRNFSGETSPNYLHNPISKVSVLIVSYNHEAYIAEALDSVLAQQGDFEMEVIVADDFSTDRTLSIINSYVQCIEDNPKFQVKILPSGHNLGIVKNYQRAFGACTGKYLAICEGDDYWLSPNKIQMQIEFMKSHDYCSLCFHNLYIYWQDRGKFEAFEAQQNLSDEFISTKDLILFNIIGNFSVCFYDTQYLKNIPAHLYDLSFADWMFNIVYSQYGQMGHLNEDLSVYRKHKGGYWAGRAAKEGVNILYEAIDAYNKFLDFEYDQEFRQIQQSYEMSGSIEKKVDLLVLDDYFPDPVSGFRWQEYLAYLAEFPSITIATTGDGRIQYDHSDSFRKLVSDFKRKYPNYANKLIKYYPEINFNVKVVSLDFLSLTYRFLEHIEKLAVPFVFTLYPGGTFQIDDPNTNLKLNRIFSSPCFRKVIVTQQITFDYLIDHNFCTPDQIEFIFGCVAPQSQFVRENYDKHHFGVHKDTLDICFVAHRYTEKGLSKGYDVFIDVAHRLSQLYPNIHFHVVGGFDETVLDVSEIKDKITFYGVRKTEWFDVFYRNIDIILSPNIHTIQTNGVFDGFPTTTCVDAGIRYTAIFCTDELHLNNQYFIDGEEIVIVPHHAGKITEIIETYYQDPEKLKAIAINGRQKILQLYSYESQISPRVRLLKNEIELSAVNKPKIAEELVRREEGESTDVQGESLIAYSPPKSLMSRVKRRFKSFFINKDVKLLRYSGLFDEKWYLEKNPDVAAAQVNPYRHYLLHGAYEGRNPSPRFDSRWYLKTYPDVRRSGMNPLVHYLRFGKSEGRIPQKTTRI